MTLPVAHKRANRRSFLEKGAAAAASLISVFLFLPAGYPGAWQPGPNSRINIALIGSALQGGV